MPTRSINLKQAIRELDAAATAERRSRQMFTHGTLQVLLYAPREKDLQEPHTRDEIYVVAQGEGIYVNGEQRGRFGPGDCLFAAAGEVHRFEEFTDDFYAWVFFYGPEGGEGGA